MRVCCAFRQRRKRGSDFFWILHGVPEGTRRNNVVDPNVVEEAVAILQAVQRVVNAPNGVAKLHRFFCRNIPKKYSFDPYAWEGVNETQLSERGASKTVAWGG